MAGLIQGLFSNDIGIDLGTANTLVYAKDRGVILSEPSVVAVYNNSKKVLAVGEKAKRMLGRTPGNITALRPMKDGVIADFEITEAMLRYFINKANTHLKFTAPRVVVAVPSGITEVERRAVKESAIRAGARLVYLLDEPLAAAIGVGLPVWEPTASMIVDIGGGTTEVAIISLAGVVFAKSVRVGGDKIDDEIIQYMKRAYNLMIGVRMAEEIKIKIGSAFPLEKELTMEVKGRDCVAGLPKTLQITSQEIREALDETFNKITDVIGEALEHCPPELSADLVDKGIVLAGGGSLIRNLNLRITDRTLIPCFAADEPLNAVANGTGKVLNDLSWWANENS
ncbi:MAG: rod shape-determining protein [Opitutales bacterium]|nr:rod shape-determining protein [Opitutales bacterium]